MLELSREMCLLFLFRLRHYVSLFDSISKLVHVGRGQKDTNDLTALCFYPLKFRIVFGLQTVPCTDCTDSKDWRFLHWNTSLR